MSDETTKFAVNPLKYNGNNMYYQLQHCVSQNLLTDYYPIIITLNCAKPVDLCNVEALCFLLSTDWIFKYYLDKLRNLKL
jgi:hypothetical protein